MDDERTQGFVVDTPVGAFSCQLKRGVLLSCGFKQGPETDLSPAAQRLKRELRRYFSTGTADFSWVKLHRDSVSVIAMRVYRHLIRHVGPGQTTSYSRLARSLRTSPRAVGSVMAANPWPVIVPCHRVLRSDGSLGGYSGGLHIKKWLLTLEADTSEAKRPGI